MNVKLLLGIFILLSCTVSAVATCGEYGDWQAQVIEVGGNPKLHYLDDLVWEFGKSHEEDVARWLGRNNYQFSSSGVNFTTTQEGQLVFGDFSLDDPHIGEYQIGKEWYQQAWPWAVQVKIAQTKERSEWVLEAAYRIHGKTRTVKRKATLVGRDKQVLQIDMGPLRNAPIYALRLSTSTYGNAVSVEWVKVVRPSLPKIFRYTFDLSEDVLGDRLAFSASGFTSIYVNGTKIGTHGARYPFRRSLSYYDAIPGLRKGLNTVCVSLEGYGPFSVKGRPGPQFFFMEGAVFGANGILAKIKSDRQWEGTYSQNNCAMDGTSAGQAALVKGDVRKHWPVLADVGDNEKLGRAPYLGPVELDFPGGYPIYVEGERVKLEVGILGYVKNPIRSVAYQLRKWSNDSAGERDSIISGRVELTGGELDIGRVEKGVYELSITVELADETREERRQEIVVVGHIDQRPVAAVPLKTGLRLKLVDRLGFTSDDAATILCADKAGKKVQWLGEGGSTTSIGKSFLGAHLTDRYLELGPQHSAWCSAKFKVENLERPHLIEVEYPQDGKRNMLFIVAESSPYVNLHNIGSQGAVPRLNNGVYTSGDQGNGVSRYIYWPNSTEATITVVNAGRGRVDRGAISNFSVYEIEDDLPRFKTAPSVLDGGALGPFVERVDRTMPRLFYQGELGAKFSEDLMGGYFPGYYSAWYNAIENLVKYLRFSGQNTYYAGIYMYYGGWYESERFQGHTQTGVNSFPAGWRNGVLPLMARIFEKNGLNLVLGIQFIGSNALVKLDTKDDRLVGSGEETVRFVNKTGRQAYGFQAQGYNFLVPRVEEEIMKLVDEVGKQFSPYQAIKGITWMRVPEYTWYAEESPRQSSPFDTGYGDYTIGLYINETGSGIPTWSETDKNRFKKRYQWLITNEKESWITWRAKKVADIDRKIAKKIKSYNENWRLWRIVPRPVPRLIKLWRNGDLSILDVYRYGGIDPVQYRKQDGVQLLVIQDVGAEKKYEKRRSISGLSRDVLSFYASDEFNQLFKNQSVFVHVGFMLEGKLENSMNWPWNKLTVVGYSVPAARGLLPFLRRAGELNSPSIAVGWSDVGHFSGSVEDIREFVGSK